MMSLICIYMIFTHKTVELDLCHTSHLFWHILFLFFSMRINAIPFVRKNSNCYQLQVMKILAWDTKNHLVYYLGTMDKRPGQQHLYIVKDPLNHDTQKYVRFNENYAQTCLLFEYIYNNRCLLLLLLLRFSFFLSFYFLLSFTEWSHSV